MKSSSVWTFCKNLLGDLTWFVAGSSLIIIIVVLGLAVYTRTARFHQLLHDQLVALLQNSLDAEVSFTDVGGSVWQGLEMRALSIRKDGVEVISLERATVTVDILSQALMAWHTSSFHITDVTLTGPVMHLVQDPKAGWNVAHLLKPAEPGPEQSQAPRPLRILLPRLTVEKGQILVRLADGKEFQVTCSYWRDRQSASGDVYERAEFGTGGYSLAVGVWQTGQCAE